jgi:hypothetical protein
MRSGAGGRFARDPLITAEAIRELRDAGYSADALRSIDGLSGDLKTASSVRVAAGDIYNAEHLRAHAVNAYGNGGGLEACRRNQWACWWRSGGPAKWIRSAISNAEYGLLFSLRPSAVQETALSALSLPPETAEAARADQAAYRLSRFQVTTFLPDLRDAWLQRIVSAAVILAIFGALASAETLRWPSDPTPENLAAAALATADHVVFSVGLALAALAAIPFIVLLLWAPTQLGRRVRIARWGRSQAEEAALDELLVLLGHLLAPPLRRDAPWRRKWMADLERLAVIIERDLPHTLASGDPSSQRAVTANARGAAAALRQMKETIALPAETSWRELTDQLTGLARALAGHDFSNWPPPMPEVTAKRPARPPWRRVTDAARTAIVICAPPLVAFLLPLVAPLSGPGLQPRPKSMKPRDGPVPGP